ncbi:glutamyl-tRNA reductase [Candidatus Poribacteria bacterium]
MFVTAVGVSHKKTPVEVRERLALNSDGLPSLYKRLKASGKIAGCVIISTCNRTEIYANSRNADAALSEIWGLLSEESGIDSEPLQDYLYNLTCQEAIAHLFRVTTGLDSMILGEQEILGQVARAYQTACENGASNCVMNVLFQKALKVGKQVRTETRISNGASSVGSAAVEMAKQTFGDIQNSAVMLIGAGEMGRLVARNLANNSTSEVMVCNRSYDRAQELASEFDGSAVPFDDLFEYMPRADIVVSCTSAPDYIISEERLAPVMEEREGNPIFLIDLAVPRDIEPGLDHMECVHSYNIDSLQSIVDESLDEREQEARKAEAIIEGAIDNFSRWINNRHAVPVIKALCKKGEEIRDSELEKALRKLGDVTEREEKILRSMVHSVVNRMSQTAIVQLKKHSQTDQGPLYAQVMRNLFDLPVQHDDESKMLSEL